ncbi:MAG: hypothetical protein EP329_01830, partial [Deltaproteobacteria bacterium]
MKKRLFWQIYGGFVLIALVCVVAAGVVSVASSDDAPPAAVRGMAELITRDLRADDPALGDRLARRGRRLSLELALFSATGEP